MSVTYAVAVKTARMTATRDRFAGGSLEILTAADALLATFVLTGPGGSVATDTWTLAFVAGTVAAGATGTAAKAQIKTAGAAAEVTGLTVGLSAADIILDSLSFTAGQNITLSAAALQHA